MCLEFSRHTPSLVLYFSVYVAYFLLNKLYDASLTLLNISQGSGMILLSDYLSLVHKL